MNDYLELNALYHYGVKGQKWGIIREDDDQKTRLASEKNRLNYDKQIAKINAESDTEKSIAISDNKTAIILGRQGVQEAMARERTLRSESYNERKEKEQKYKVIGSIAVMAALTLPKVIKNAGKYGL